MKRLTFLILFMLLPVVVFGSPDLNRWTTATVTFSDADTLLGSVSDTSNVITIPQECQIQGVRSKEVGWCYPDEVQFLFHATEYATADSTDLTFAIDFSQDSTYWYSWGTAATLTSITGAAGTTTTAKTYGLPNNNKITSIAWTGTDTWIDTTLWLPDTSTAGHAYMYYDTTYIHKTVTHGATATYTYTTETDWPKFKYARLRVTSGAVADTCSFDVEMSRWFD